ncbi:CHRD domain-containing protein [Algoriphagus hitonicola]|uniref:CHRD domain-containing protein n=1 Tax=Algoriphagus hitonicola TaxID=435880 RepID=A0A1I2RL49_9BACT|nr:CHRD domain-containing protein [Algoriphagus hitonicola]SFG38561.1 hypothetical protein SAMN04487988_103197 [Algoriphagus hitonicola]
MINNKLIFGGLLLLSSGLFLACDNNEEPMIPAPMPTGNETTFQLGSVSDPSISGTAEFIENDDNTTTINLMLSNTSSGGMHPAHIHMNTAAEGGDIVLTLGVVDGDTGMSTITVDSWDDGSPVTYAELIDYDGYINVHNSMEDLGTLLAQGDIGVNVLTGETKTYDLGEVAVPGISGTATFSERVNGETLVELMLMNTPEDGMHPAHIHFNTAAESGDIAVSFNPVDGSTGRSLTNISMLDDESAITYDELLDFDGYINVHLSMEELATIVAQGDIGQNELTGESKEYVLGERDVDGISGTATFFERVNGEALAEIMLMNTPEDGMHPAHIHFNSAIESGDIAFTFNSVNGATGISKTNVSMLDDETPFTYSDVLDFNGYINVHLSMEELSTIVAQGDIGSNELTGESTTYNLLEVDIPGVSGTATFRERKDGSTLAVIELENTVDGASHPAHIHENSAEEGGDIAVSFNPVDGTTGMSMTHIRTLDDESAITYSELLEFDGYVNVHLSMEQLATLVAQGNIGSNVN